ncbi:tetratricopeptide repeat protein [Aliarcobacter butzleri]|uniref:tetratricopeptide repeat protein n=1 Tax=Aliarcobacter TaxID=2321111 RepID=UPI001260AF59|nr:tetratricopeptide repeat protein [Aliarcobacter butzleri]
MKKIIVFVIFITTISFSASIHDGIKAYEHKDYKTALNIFKELGDFNTFNEELAQYYLGKMYFKGIGVEKDYEESHRWYLLSALQGNKESQFFSGFMYNFGKNKDYKKAKIWYEKSALQGHAEAQYNLAELYYHGSWFGIEQSLKKAAEWYEKAAIQSHTNAQLQLGIMYSNGWGVRQDLKIAKEWYGKVCDSGNQVGCDNYKKLNEQGF